MTAVVRSPPSRAFAGRRPRLNAVPHRSTPLRSTAIDSQPTDELGALVLRGDTLFSIACAQRNWRAVRAAPTRQKRE